MHNGSAAREGRRQGARGKRSKILCLAFFVLLRRSREASAAKTTPILLYLRTRLESSCWSGQFCGYSQCSGGRKACCMSCRHEDSSLIPTLISIPILFRYLSWWYSILKRLLIDLCPLNFKSPATQHNDASFILYLDGKRHGAASSHERCKERTKDKAVGKVALDSGTIGCSDIGIHKQFQNLNRPRSLFLRVVAVGTFVECVVIPCRK